MSTIRPLKSDERGSYDELVRLASLRITGIAKLGPSVRLTRTVIEIVLLGLGWMLGGTFGVGTVAFALFIGPIVQFAFRIWPMEVVQDEVETTKAR